MKWVIVPLVLLIIGSCLSNQEGFNPYYADKRTSNYPDQTYDGNLIIAEKSIQDLLDNPDLSNEQKTHLNDLLILLQFI